jgi:hypothetical protein
MHVQKFEPFYKRSGLLQISFCSHDGSLAKQCAKPCPSTILTEARTHNPQTGTLVTGRVAAEHRPGMSANISLVWRAGVGFLCG